MPSDIYWIAHPGPFRLATMARPRAGDWLEDEVTNWKSQGVDLVISLLERHEVDDLALREEANLCAAYGIEFRSLPIVDRGVPDEMAAVARLARELAASTRTIAVHCRAGIGRSSLLAAAILCASGVEPEASWATIQNARGLPVPDTNVQREWLVKFFDHVTAR